MRTPLPVIDADVVACCSPVTGGVLDTDQAHQLARVFKALGDPTRVLLLSMIAAHDGGEACVCELTDPVGLSQPTVSHHLKQLVDAGLISREQRGKWAYYRMVEGMLSSVADALRAPNSAQPVASTTSARDHSSTSPVSPTTAARRPSRKT
jgi:ArsR family transcriptional regulator